MALTKTSMDVRIPHIHINMQVKTLITDLIFRVGRFSLRNDSFRTSKQSVLSSETDRFRG